MLVEPRVGAAVFQQDPTLSVQNLERAIQTEIQVLKGQRVRERVRDDLDLEALPANVRASPVGSTDVVSVRVRHQDPALGPGPRRRVCPGLRLDATGAGHRQPRTRRGGAERQGRRAAGADRRRRPRATCSARRAAGRLQGAVGPAADRRRSDDGRDIGREVRRSPDCTGRTAAVAHGDARRVRRAVARAGSRVPRRVPRRLDPDRRRSASADGRAGARRRSGRTAAGQPSDRPQRAARVRRRDLPRPAHQRAVPRPGPGAARDPGDQLAAR